MDIFNFLNYSLLLASVHSLLLLSLFDLMILGDGRWRETGRERGKRGVAILCVCVCVCVCVRACVEAGEGEAQSETSNALLN